MSRHCGCYSDAYLSEVDLASAGVGPIPVKRSLGVR